ncbi:MAG TPA: ABC transporter substrate-binding protein [Methylomirabilota bacterium]|jgi:phospholipid transport system substrate-binding protein|nr:ABC transporter substrate-binding protein [Methylomirabilota bacterium]
MRTWIAIAISIACLLPAQAAQPAPAVGPRDAVEGAVGRFMTIVQAKGSAGVNVDRSEQIRQIVREMFDFDEISKRALSRHWQTLQREEQAEFVALFRDLLERAYLAQVETASGSEKIAFTGESIENESATVRSKVVTRQGSEMPIDYRLHVRDGSWRIYDVAVQGVSFIASYRTQFDRVIRAESYSSLRERLQKKATETTAAQR